MTSSHKTYDTEFKLEVARLVAEQGLSVLDVMKSTGVGRTAIHRWVAQYRAEEKGQSGVGTPPYGGTAANSPIGIRKPATQVG